MAELAVYAFRIYYCGCTWSFIDRERVGRPPAVASHQLICAAAPQDDDQPEPGLGWLDRMAVLRG